jgi:membrane protein DedA with SNARE-associated domain
MHWYTYIIIYFGVLIEGEFVLLSSIIASHHGNVNSAIIMAVAAFAAFTSDLFYFNLSRIKGAEWVKKKKKVAEKILLLEKQLQRLPFIIFISYRFLLGFRTITPLALGATSISLRKFMLFSFISTAIWALIYGLLGHFFGNIIIKLIGQIEQFEKYLISIVVMSIIAYLFYKRRLKKLTV